MYTFVRSGYLLAPLFAHQLIFPLFSPLASSMVAPALMDISMEFGITDSTLLAFVVSVFLLAFALGPLFIAYVHSFSKKNWLGAD